MSSSLLISLGLAAVSGPVLIGWVAAARVARRRGLTFLAASLDHRSWQAEPVLGLRAGLLMALWGAVALVAFLVAASWPA